jgi:hypothetical protein
MHKGFKCLDPKEGWVYISRDVVFDESIFPFASLHPNAGARLAQNLIFYLMCSKIPPRILGMQNYMTNICYLLPLLMQYPSLVMFLLTQGKMRQQI